MIAALLGEIVATLEAHGVPATVDPARLHPPCAFVTAVRISHYTLSGEMAISAGVTLVAPDSEIPTAYARLDALLTRALDAVGHLVTDSDLGTSVTLPDGATCPAYRLTITTAPE